MRNKIFHNSIALFLSLVMVTVSALSGVGSKATIVEAAVVSKGSLATEVTGTTGSGATNVSLLANLPTKANAGKSRFTTANYDANNGAVDTSNWGTSMLWDLDGSSEPYGYAVFAIPWAYKGINVEMGEGENKETVEGMLFSKPSTQPVNNGNGTGYVLSLAPSENDSEFCVVPGYATNGLKVDNITDWTYDVVMQKKDDPSTYMKTTMVQGSPFAYFEMVGTNTVTIKRVRRQSAEIVNRADDGSMFVIRVFDPHDKQWSTGNCYDYYAFYAPSGTTWTTEDTSNGAYGITAINATFPQGKSYFSSAILIEQKDTNAEEAIAIAKAYKPYAYNFVTDTRAEYSYNEETHKLTTTYTYTVDKKSESTADGTIMGILPHQYKNISGMPFYMSNTIDSLRGTIKLIKGSSFTTELTFSGILPWLTDVDEENIDTLSGYVDEYMKQFFPTGTATESSFTTTGTGTGADTYWTGKALNRTSNVLAAAEAVGDEESADILLEGLKSELANWFTADGANDNKYFYYDEGIGALFGFPESFNSVDQINDHHFHYGYFIYTAAQVALRDPEWGQQYSGIVRELIDDIACSTRNNSDSRYPYLRNFAPFEGHSWASGHANFNDGNNQESSSEAINAWAGIILFGEAIGDEELRDLGIYLYTTEISAINNYWFDVDENVLADYYRYLDQYDHLNEEPPKDAVPTFNQASMVWGSKYEFTTWFGAHPMLVQGINLLPMNPSSFYLSLRSDYILENWEIAKKHAVDSNWTPDYNTVWNDVWSAYIALADPDAADEFWGRLGSEEGESKAHTYQYIYSLKKAGKPDLTITSNATFSTCFVKDGVKTYVAYNAGDTEKTVKFSDGKEVIVQPKTMETLVGNETQGNTQYTIVCYAPELDAEGNETGRYEVIKTVTDRANVDSTISVEAPNVYGYVFDETHSSNMLTGEIPVNGDGLLVLKAYYKRNTCTVTFNSNGGSKVETKSVRIGKTVTKPVNPTKEGYEFDGWYKGTESFDFSTAITENIILTAKWRKIVENTDKPARGDIGIERNGNNLIMYMKSNQASGVAFLKTVSSLDETVSTDGVGAISSDLNPVVKNGDYLEFTIVNGANTYAGQYIAYWFNLSYLTPKTVAVSEIPNVGDYKAVDTTNYVVTFTSDGDTLGSQLVQEGETAYKPLNPKKNGYTFAGWYYKDSSYDFSAKVTQNITLSAKWVQNIAIKSITFDKDVVTVAPGETIKLNVTIKPENATNQNLQWSCSSVTYATVTNDGVVTTKASGKGKKVEVTAEAVDGSRIKATCIIKIALSDSSEDTDNPETSTIKVTGVTLNKQEVTLESGQTEILAAMVSPTDATNKDVKWTSDNPTVATVDATGKVTALADGTATITVTTNDGGYAASCTVTVNDTSSDSSTDDNDNEDVDTDSDDDSFEMEEKKYKVTFDSAGGTAVESQTVTEGKYAEDPEDPIREGYDFAGWYKNGQEYDFDTEITEDITLTAQWDVISIEKVKITGISTKIATGKSVQLRVIVTPSEAVVENVTWQLVKKSDSKYAEINTKGKLTTKKKGAGKSVNVKATITGLDGEKITKTQKIYIKRHQVKKLSIVGKKNLTVKAGKSVNLKSRVKITTTGNSVNKTLKWTTSDKTIATVSSSGNVKLNKKAKKNSKVKITAQSTDGTNKKVTFTIEVK